MDLNILYKHGNLLAFRDGSIYGWNGMWDLHPFRAIRGDNGLFSNQLTQILADGLFHPLIVPQAILEPSATQFPWQCAITPTVCTALRHITSPAPACY